MSEAPVTAAGLQIPSDPQAPIALDFDTHALRVVFVARENLGSLPVEEWSQPGVYVLLGPIGDSSAKTRVYVGKATALRQRLFEHRRNPKLSWWRAIAVARDTTNGFNSAEIGYIEGRLARQLGSLPAVEVVARREDIDETLADHLLVSLDAFVSTILGAIRLAGVDTARPEEKPKRGRSKRSRTTHAGSVAELIAAGLLKPGETLTFSQRGKQAQGSVNAAGELLIGGIAYATPSAAGSAVLGGKSVNGWEAWRLGESGPSLSVLRERLQASGGSADA